MILYFSTSTLEVIGCLTRKAIHILRIVHLLRPHLGLLDVILLPLVVVALVVVFLVGDVLVVVVVLADLFLVLHESKVLHDDDG